MQDCSLQQPRGTPFLEVAMSLNERLLDLYPVLLFSYCLLSCLLFFEPRLITEFICKKNYAIIYEMLVSFYLENNRPNWKIYIRMTNPIIVTASQRNTIISRVREEKGNGIYSGNILLPQLSFPSLFKDTISNPLFRSRKDVIESRFLSAPTFEAFLWKRLTCEITRVNSGNSFVKSHIDV